jgi:hypothetical protein
MLFFVILKRFEEWLFFIILTFILHLLIFEGSSVQSDAQNCGHFAWRSEERGAGRFGTANGHLIGVSFDSHLADYETDAADQEIRGTHFFHFAFGKTRIFEVCEFKSY